MDNPNNNNVVLPSDSSTSSSSSSSISNNRDQFLRHLNKLSHKISKPPPPSSSKKPLLHHPQPPPQQSPSFNPPPPPPPPPPPLPPSSQQQQQQQQLQQHQQLQQQPPVYNINKSDFRDVVQKLTGSPAHAPPPSHAPPPQHHQIHPQPKPASSRLQRIRPPPLAQLTTRPPHLLTSSSVNPLSPLPPLPTCHGSAESPISAYMRFLNSSVDGGGAGGFNRMMGQMPPPLLPPTSNTMDVPNYGWFPSPKSPCQLLSPNLLFSPTGNGGPLGFPQLPLSPTVPGVPSPK